MPVKESTEQETAWASYFLNDDDDHNGKQWEEVEQLRKFRQHIASAKWVHFPVVYCSSNTSSNGSSIDVLAYKTLDSFQTVSRLLSATVFFQIFRLLTGNY